MKEKNNLTDSLKELEKIISWFELQNEIDVEEGLRRVQEGAKLVEKCRKRLKDVENEFKIIREDLKDSE
ncbi:MAG: exodeoxyribonuclease VII small subunit [Candidatus Moraniibacteriota bacterium]|nr:MAG: exodeoxyribonuclease VII small subunit [Candidatus Moranbacteria bacterium]